MHSEHTIARTASSLVVGMLQAGEDHDDELFYTDKRGGRDHECLSLGCDHAAVLAGRTPLQAYADFAAEFARQCGANKLWGESPLQRFVSSCRLKSSIRAPQHCNLHWRKVDAHEHMQFYN